MSALPLSHRHAEQATGLPQALPDGARLLDFEVMRLISQDCSGNHYLGWDRVARQQVLIKEYLPAALASRSATSQLVMPSTRQQREAFNRGLRAFKSEARLLTRFHHAALIRVLRFWELNGTAYMALPCHESPSLASLLDTLERPVPELDLRAWLDPLLEALHALHAAHCIHGAIAPQTILLGAQGPLLLDFGAAQRALGLPASASADAPEVGYAPIELCDEAAALPTGPWTDLYALAAVIHAAITGQAPTASARRLAGEALTPLAQLAEGHYSAAFLQALDAALAVLPQDRPQSVAQFQALLAASPSASPFESVVLPSRLSVLDASPDIPGLDSGEAMPSVMAAAPSPAEGGDWSERLREFMGENGELPVQDGWWQPAAAEQEEEQPGMAWGVSEPDAAPIDIGSPLPEAIDASPSPAGEVVAPVAGAGRAGPLRRHLVVALAALALLGASVFGYRMASTTDAPPPQVSAAAPKAVEPAFASRAPPAPPAPPALAVSPAPPVSTPEPAAVEAAADVPAPNDAPPPAASTLQAASAPHAPSKPSEPSALAASTAPTAPSVAAQASPPLPPTALAQPAPSTRARIPTSSRVQTASVTPPAPAEPAAPPRRVAPVSPARHTTPSARCSDLLQRASLEPVTPQQAQRLKESCR